MPDLPPAFLAYPGVGDDSVAKFRANLCRLALKHLARIPKLSPVRAPIIELFERDPKRVIDAVGEVDVLGPILCHREGLTELETVANAVSRLLSNIATSFASPIRWQDTEYGGELHPQNHGALRHSIPGAHPTVHITDFDSNPIANVEDHPDKSGNRASWGNKPVGSWQRSLGDACELIAGAMPNWYTELPSAVTRFVPVGFDAQKHLSASYREVPGLAYLSLHPDVLTMAEAIVHETQHNKLNMVTFFDPVLTNGHDEWTRSEVRPDMRPLHGVLLAVHAFVPVALLHCAMVIDSHPMAQTGAFKGRKSDVLESNQKGLETLSRLAKPTEVGRRVLDGLERLHEFTQSAAS